MAVYSTLVIFVPNSEANRQYSLPLWVNIPDLRFPTYIEALAHEGHGNR